MSDFEIVRAGVQADPSKLGIYLPTAANVRALAEEGHPLAFPLMLDQHATVALNTLVAVGFKFVWTDETPASMVADQPEGHRRFAQQARAFADSQGSECTADTIAAVEVLEHIARLSTMFADAPNDDVRWTIALAALMGSSASLSASGLKGSENITRTSPEGIKTMQSKGGEARAKAARWWHGQALERGRYLCRQAGESIPDAADKIHEELTRAHFHNGVWSGGRGIPKAGGVAKVLRRFEVLGWPEHLPDGYWKP